MNKYQVLQTGLRDQLRPARAHHATPPTAAQNMFISLAGFYQYASGVEFSGRHLMPGVQQQPTTWQLAGGGQSLDLERSRTMHRRALFARTVPASTGVVMVWTRTGAGMRYGPVPPVRKAISCNQHYKQQLREPLVSPTASKWGSEGR
jgi:hypothetical protein